MRQTILLGLCALLAVGVANDACAQHHGGAGHGFARSGHALGHARGAYHFTRARGNHARSRARGSYASGRARVISPYAFGYGYLPYDSGDAYLSYDSGDEYAYQAPQPVVFVQQPPVIVQPPAPPAVETPAEPVIKEYKWPAADLASSDSNSGSQDFAIVLKDGSTLSAVTVFVSRDGLHYVDTDERHLCIPISEIDRAATLKLNRARDLNLYLPAPQ